MKRTPHNRSHCNQAVSWTLVLTMLVWVLFPFHYHLHHHDHPSPKTVSSQDHTIEFHSILGLDLGEAKHQTVDHTIDSSSGMIVKSIGVQLPFVALILFILLPLPPLTRLGRCYQTLSNLKLPNSLRHKVPPLRAPPLH